MKLKNLINGKTFAVHATTNSSASNYGRAVWVTDDDEPVCEVGLEAGYEVIDDSDDLTYEQRVRRDLGEVIREARTYRGMTQSELAIKVGILQPNIVRIEKGRYSIRYDLLCRIVEALDCHIKIIANEDDENQPE